MTGVQLVLGAVAGVAVGAALTVLRWAVARRLAAPPSVPASAEVLAAEHDRSLTDRSTP